MTETPGLRWRPMAAAIGVVALLSALGQQEGKAQGDARNLIPEVRLDQDEINAGLIEFDRIFAAGKHIFSNRFTPADSFGEAPDGPRRSLQALAGRPNLPFIRFNGLDSQSCLECHLSVGFALGPESLGDMRAMKEPGTTAGGAGAASNAFGFDQFPFSTVGFVRNPPHVFGAGYTQRLADEMSEDLFELRREAIAAVLMGGEPVQVELVTKGVKFGRLAIRADGQIDTELTAIEGVSEDLIVRPFQFKGLASSLRNFVAGAMNFHFSVQPKELLDRGVVPNDNPNGTAPGDVLNEILEGEISAVSIFAAFVRPPAQNASGLNVAMVSRGSQVFSQVACDSCHVPRLRIEDARVTVIDPRPSSPGSGAQLSDSATERSVGPPARPTLTVAEKSSDRLPVRLQYDRHGLVRNGAARPEGAPTHPADRLAGYTRSLNLTDGPIETVPRLRFDPLDGAVAVPLYSDLKRHKMGAGLAESFTQETDVAGIRVAGDAWLTRPLWGVADTGPWLHDGRALTLRDAIMMHEGPGSEANGSIAAYNGLPPEDQAALREFLLTLRLPTLNFPAVNGAASAVWGRY